MPIVVTVLTTYYTKPDLILPTSDKRWVDKSQTMSIWGSLISCQWLWWTHILASFALDFQIINISIVPISLMTLFIQKFHLTVIWRKAVECKSIWSKSVWHKNSICSLSPILRSLLSIFIARTTLAIIQTIRRFEMIATMITEPKHLRHFIQSNWSDWDLISGCDHICRY